MADKLAARVPITRVLNEIRETIATVGREDLMTRQDVFTIHRAYNIEGVQKHKNDQTSIHAWVNKMSALPYNPILLFKGQG